MSLRTKYCIGLFLGIATFVAAYNAYAADTGSETAAIQAADNKGSLTDYIQNEKEKAPVAANDNSEGTWLGNAIENLANKGSKVLSGGKDKKHKRPVKRSNASVFDISGIMLRMDLAQVNDAMQKRGYKKTAVKLEIPNFIRWRYDEQCRNQGIVGYERSASCVNQLAKKNNYQYVQHISFNNYHTKETIDVFLTSNFTGNKVYRVMYQTDAAHIKGTGPKAEYLRNLKIFDFWKKINQKYGRPDNPDRVTWGLGENKPSLQADTGHLVLYDPMLLELDYARMSREDQKFMNTAVYTF